MTTVIAVYDSDGCRGRCDARCHDAKEPDCDCICGGRLHGVGAGQAIAVHIELLDPDGKLRELFAQKHGLDAGELRLEHGQGALFS